MREARCQERHLDTNVGTQAQAGGEQSWVEQIRREETVFVAPAGFGGKREPRVGEGAKDSFTVETPVVLRLVAERVNDFDTPGLAI